MKNTQKLLTWILVVVLIVATLVLVACVDKPQTIELDNLTLPKLNDDQAVIIVRNRNDTYTLHVVTVGAKGTDATTVEGALNYLAELGKLSYTANGTMLDNIANLNPNSDAHEYVSLYTSVTGDWGQGASDTAYKIGDDIYVGYSQYGFKQMKFVAGAIIYFEIATW